MEVNVFNKHGWQKEKNKEKHEAKVLIDSSMYKHEKSFLFSLYICIYVHILLLHSMWKEQQNIYVYVICLKNKNSVILFEHISDISETIFKKHQKELLLID